MTPQTPPDPTQQWMPPQQPQPSLPKPQQPTPLDPPVVYYNTKWRVPPLVVDTQEQADALDPSEWITNPPSAATKAEEQYPKLFANVTVQPKIVGSEEEAAALGDGWREFSLPDSLCKAAEAANAAKAAAAAAKAQAQSQSQPQGQAQSPTYPGQYYPGQYYPGQAPPTSY